MEKDLVLGIRHDDNEGFRFCFFDSLRPLSWV